MMFDAPIGNAFSRGDWARGVALTAIRGADDAAVGGRISEFTGGNFKDGFIGSGVSSVLFPAFGAIPGLQKSVASRTAVAAVIGGTASELTGGKFASGAMSAAITHLFNEELLTVLEERRWLLNEQGVGNMPLTIDELKVILEYNYKNGLMYGVTETDHKQSKTC